MLAAVLTSAATGSGLGMLTRDVTTLSSDAGAELPFYAGAISLLNGMVWASTAAMAFLVGSLRPSRRRWLVLFGSFVLVLTVDDALTLHEIVGPSHRVPEGAFYLSYAIVAVLLLRGALTRPHASSTAAFLLGGALLALSILIDRVSLHQYLVEDGAKLLGAAVWLTVPLLSLDTSEAGGRT